MDQRLAVALDMRPASLAEQLIDAETRRRLTAVARVHPEVLVDLDSPAARKALMTGRIEAILDVTDPEPLPPDHPLWSLPNALLTPHVAGSMGNELPRLGESAVAEVERLAAGLPVLHPETLRAV